MTIGASHLAYHPLSLFQSCKCVICRPLWGLCPLQLQASNRVLFAVQRCYNNWLTIFANWKVVGRGILTKASWAPKQLWLFVKRYFRKLPFNPSSHNSCNWRCHSGKAGNSHRL